MVVKRGVNDTEVGEMARRFAGPDFIVRFIEYMDVGLTNGWRMDQVVSGREIVERIAQELPLEPVNANYPGEVAKRYRYLDGTGELGIITSVTRPFCGDCGRLRLIADDLVTLSDAVEQEVADETALRERRSEVESELSGAQALAGKLEKTSLAFPVKTGEGGKMFGAITSADIHEKLTAAGFAIDRKKIHLFTPVKTLGKHTV